jgi:hypothetical protein
LGTGRIEGMYKCVYGCRNCIIVGNFNGEGIRCSVLLLLERVCTKVDLELVRENRFGGIQLASNGGNEDLQGPCFQLCCLPTGIGIVVTRRSCCPPRWEVRIQESSSTWTLNGMDSDPNSWKGSPRFVLGERGRDGLQITCVRYCFLGYKYDLGDLGMFRFKFNRTGCWWDELCSDSQHLGSRRYVKRRR